MADVAMPRLSDSMEEGTILKWLKSDGDSVAQGEELVEIETDKANMTYEADEEGTLTIVAQEGDTLAVGETICKIGEASGGDDSSDDEESGDDDSGGDEDESTDEAEESSDDEADDAESGDDDTEAASDDADEEESGDDDAEAASDADADADEEEYEDEDEESADEESEDEDSGDDAADDQPADDEEPDADESSGDEDADAESGDDDEGEDGEPDEEASDEPAGEEDADQPAEEEPEPEDAGGGRVKASPIAKRMARDLGIDLAQVEGTGPGGRIVKADVEAFADESGGGRDDDEAPAEDAPADEPEAEESADEPEADADEAPAEEEPADEPEPEAADEPAAEEPEQVPEPVATQEDKKSGRGEVTKQELTRIQQTVARRMAESKATAPEFVITAEVDMTDAVALRGQFKAAVDGPPPSLNDFVIKASALALRDFPRANGAYRDGAFELYGRVNVGLAVAGQDALIVPTIFDADEKSLGAIATESRALAERVRAGEITPPELSSGTFTVSNLGMFGIRTMVAVINPPQAAILGVGEIVRRPVYDDTGQVVARSLMQLTLTCDHRILYGADAASFLGRIREYLETPLRLAL